MINISEMNFLYIQILCGVIILIFLYFGVVVRRTVIERYGSGKKQKVKITNLFKKGFVVKIYYKTGKINKVVPYRKGLINGKVNTFYKSGKVYMEDIYSMGKLKEYRVFDQIGKEVNKQIMK